MLWSLLAGIVMVEGSRSKLPPDKQKKVNRHFWKVIGVPALIMLMMASCSTMKSSKAETRTFRNSMGQETGRAVTNGNTTTFTNPLGQQTGRAVTTGGTTTIYNPLGQTTGTIRSNR